MSFLMLPLIAFTITKVISGNIALALGSALIEAVGEKKGIFRYGHSYVPMDETLIRTALDFCQAAQNLSFRVNLLSRRLVIWILR